MTLGTRLIEMILTVSLFSTCSKECTHKSIGLLRVLDDLEESAAKQEDEAALLAVKDCRLGLEKHIARMNNLEAGFDKIAERSCSCHLLALLPLADDSQVLSASRVSHARRQCQLF